MSTNRDDVVVRVIGWLVMRETDSRFDKIWPFAAPGVEALTGTD